MTSSDTWARLGGTNVMLDALRKAGLTPSTSGLGLGPYQITYRRGRNGKMLVFYRNRTPNGDLEAFLTVASYRDRADALLAEGRTVHQIIEELGDGVIYPREDIARPSMPDPAPAPKPSEKIPRMQLKGRLDPEINPVAGVDYHKSGRDGTWRCSWVSAGVPTYQDWKVSKYGYDEARFLALALRHKVMIQQQGDKYLSAVAAGAHDPFPGVDAAKRPALPEGFAYFNTVVKPAERKEGHFAAIPTGLNLSEVEILHYRVMRARQVSRASDLHDMIMAAMLDNKEQIDVGSLTIDRFNALFGTVPE